MRVKMRINLNTPGKIAVRGAVVTPPKTWQVVAAMPLRIPSYLLRTREDGAPHTEAAHIPGGRSLRDLVFGANDGLVAAFAVVSGVHGAAVSTRIVLLAGLAELIGGTIAMGLGAFLAAKSEREFLLSEREREEREVRELPQHGRKEERTLLARQAFRRDALEQL